MKNLGKSFALAFFLLYFGSQCLYSASAQPLEFTKARFAEHTEAKEKSSRNSPAVKNVCSRLLDTSVSVPREFLDKSIHTGTLSIQRNANDAQAYLVRGLAYWRLEDALHASCDLEKAITLSPALATPQLLLILAECFAEENKNQKAIQVLTRAINAGATTSLMYLRRAQAFSQAKNYSAALQDAEKVVALNPRKRWALELRGNLNLNAGKYENAVRDFSECIKLSPEEGKLYSNRANAYEALGIKAKAAADREKRDSLNRNLGY